MESLLQPFENLLTPIFTTKSPVQLPEPWRLAIVKYAPWIMLILAPLTLLAIGLSGLAYAFDLFSGHFLDSLAVIINVIAMVLNLLAIKPLMDKKRQGWLLVFAGFSLSLLANLLTFSLFGLAIGFLIGGFFLFQVKYYYQ